MISASQKAVGTAASIIASVPPGPCTVIISNTSGQSLFIGGSSVTTSNGLGIPSGSAPLAIPGYPGSGQSQLYAVGTSATTIGVLLSTDG